MESALALRFTAWSAIWWNFSRARQRPPATLEELLFLSRPWPQGHGFDEATGAELAFLIDLLHSLRRPAASPLDANVWAIAWDAHPKVPDTTS
ncbi:hypothetical protein [Thiobacter aerophilum]|uniref:Uncharacterized protein n=1 Tax=Thiobacter aerophilum TaxID=3121275 RepID=A0ABV0EK96_9BURK